MSKTTQLYALLAVVFLIIVTIFSGGNGILIFVVLGVLLFLGIVIESTKAKD
ncbi:hypothetical protein [Flavobacterium sp.]|uniref:hypothetical protein n=1 Tax=Flavobacterium sp. TaxID=239 RepID=UPI002EDA38A0